jgi:hypothetical protein
VFFSHNKPVNSAFSTINQRNEQGICLCLNSGDRFAPLCHNLTIDCMIVFSLLLYSVCYRLILFRLCLVPHGIQNVKCQLLWNDETQNAKIFMSVFSFIQNAQFFMGWVRVFGFFFLLRPKSKMENEYLFAKNFA